MSEVWTHLIRPLSGYTAATPPPHTRVVDVSDKARGGATASTNAVEIRAIVEKMVRQGRILKPAPTPTERRAKLSIPGEKRRLTNTALNVIRCDQCGTKFKKKTRGHRFCTAECRVLGIGKLRSNINATR